MQSTSQQESVHGLGKSPQMSSVDHENLDNGKEANSYAADMNGMETMMTAKPFEDMFTYFKTMSYEPSTYPTTTVQIDSTELTTVGDGMSESTTGTAVPSMTKRPFIDKSTSDMKSDASTDSMPESEIVSMTSTSMGRDEEVTELNNITTFQTVQEDITTKPTEQKLSTTLKPTELITGTNQPSVGQTSRTVDEGTTSPNFSDLLYDRITSTTESTNESTNQVPINVTPDLDPVQQTSTRQIDSTEKENTERSFTTTVSPLFTRNDKSFSSSFSYENNTTHVGIQKDRALTKDSTELTNVPEITTEPLIPEFETTSFETEFQDSTHSSRGQLGDSSSSSFDLQTTSMLVQPTIVSSTQRTTQESTTTTNLMEGIGNTDNKTDSGADVSEATSPGNFLIPMIITVPPKVAVSRPSMGNVNTTIGDYFMTDTTSVSTIDFSESTIGFTTTLIDTAPITEMETTMEDSMTTKKNNIQTAEVLVDSKTTSMKSIGTTLVDRTTNKGDETTTINKIVPSKDVITTPIYYQSTTENPEVDSSTISDMESAIISAFSDILLKNLANISDANNLFDSSINLSSEITQRPNKVPESTTENEISVMTVMTGTVTTTADISTFLGNVESSTFALDTMKTTLNELTGQSEKTTGTTSKVGPSTVQTTEPTTEIGFHDVLGKMSEKSKEMTSTIMIEKDVQERTPPSTTEYTTNASEVTNRTETTSLFSGEQEANTARTMLTTPNMSIITTMFPELTGTPFSSILLPALLEHPTTQRDLATETSMLPNDTVQENVTAFEEVTFSTAIVLMEDAPDKQTTLHSETSTAFPTSESHSGIKLPVTDKPDGKESTLNEGDLKPTVDFKSTRDYPTTHGSENITLSSVHSDSESTTLVYMNESFNEMRTETVSPTFKVSTGTTNLHTGQDLTTESTIIFEASTDKLSTAQTTSESIVEMSDTTLVFTNTKTTRNFESSSLPTSTIIIPVTTIEAVTYREPTSIQPIGTTRQITEENLIDTSTLSAGTMNGSETFLNTTFTTTLHSIASQEMTTDSSVSESTIEMIGKPKTNDTFFTTMSTIESTNTDSSLTSTEPDQRSISETDSIKAFTTKFVMPTTLSATTATKTEADKADINTVSTTVKLITETSVVNATFVPEDQSTFSPVDTPTITDIYATEESTTKAKLSTTPSIIGSTERVPSFTSTKQDEKIMSEMDPAAIATTTFVTPATLVTKAEMEEANSSTTEKVITATSTDSLTLVTDDRFTGSTTRIPATVSAPSMPSNRMTADAATAEPESTTETATETTQENGDGFNDMMFGLFSDIFVNLLPQLSNNTDPEENSQAEATSTISPASITPSQEDSSPPSTTLQPGVMEESTIPTSLTTTEESRQTTLTATEQQQVEETETKMTSSNKIANTTSQAVPTVLPEITTVTTTSNDGETGGQNFEVATPNPDPDVALNTTEQQQVEETETVTNAPNLDAQASADSTTPSSAATFPDRDAPSPGETTFASAEGTAKPPPAAPLATADSFPVGETSTASSTGQTTSVTEQPTATTRQQTSLATHADGMAESENSMSMAEVASTATAASAANGPLDSDMTAKSFEEADNGAEDSTTAKGSTLMLSTQRPRNGDEGTAERSSADQPPSTTVATVFAALLVDKLSGQPGPTQPDQTTTTVAAPTATASAGSSDDTSSGGAGGENPSTSAEAQSTLGTSPDAQLADATAAAAAATTAPPSPRSDQQQSGTSFSQLLFQQLNQSDLRIFDPGIIFQPGLDDPPASPGPLAPRRITTTTPMTSPAATSTLPERQEEEEADRTTSYPDTDDDDQVVTLNGTSVSFSDLLLLSSAADNSSDVVVQR